jgi:hypothetical protein
VRLPDLAFSPVKVNPQSYNRYAYVLNNPLIYTDPTGHTNISDFGPSNNYGADLFGDDSNASDDKDDSNEVKEWINNQRQLYYEKAHYHYFRGETASIEEGVLKAVSDDLMSAKGAAVAAFVLFRTRSTSWTNFFRANKNGTFPDEVFAGKAPDQVTPGTKSVEGRHINDLGRVEPYRAHYDQFGRLEARTDFNAGNKAHNIPDVHHHTYEWGPGKLPLETGSHIPGEYMP